jgi:hypothetical protein
MLIASRSMMASLQRPNHGDISNGEKKGHFYWCLTEEQSGVVDEAIGREQTANSY